MNTEQIAEKLAIAYDNLGRGWVSIEKLSERSGLTAGQIAIAIRELADEGLRAEPRQIGRPTAWERANAPTFGGERVHLIDWQ